MMKRDFRISFLIVKELLGDLSDEQQRELSVWKESNETLYKRLCNPETVGDNVGRFCEFSADEAWPLLDHRIRKERRRRCISSVAAVLLPFIIISGIFMITFHRNEEVVSPVLIHVSTGRGESRAFVLPDSTRVHLNSMSRLTYPQSFSDAERRVVLEGEALFDVTPSDMPFVVGTSAMDIEVLGTLFDVSAYPDEAIRTILLEGLVKVSSYGGPECLLYPGQMAVLSTVSSELNVNDVETDFYTSWTRGRIHFRDERLEDIMSVLARWYDFEVDYAQESIKDLRFGCSVNRYEEIDPFIDLLVKTGKITVDKNGNHYTFINNN